MDNKNIPDVKAIMCFIKKNSPRQSKCIDADFINLNGLSVLAWVVEAPISNEQGYQQALFSTISQGQFGEAQSCMPCRYYKQDGKKVFTSAPFVATSEAEIPLISVNNQRIFITLNCKGKAFSQACVHE